MYNFTDTLKTTKKTIGNNACEYIIIHHTGGGSYASNCRILSWVWEGVSVHFVVWINGECAKIWQPTDILWHAGNSSRGTLEWMNSYAMGIEVVWPNKAGGFPQKQYDRLVGLIRYLMKTFNIPLENVLCHHDITRIGSKDKLLRDWKHSCRKPDIARTLWSDRWFKSFAEWRNKVLQ